MSICVFCGHSTLGGRDLCSYHDAGHDDGWAEGNRIMCDFLHRGIVSPWAPAHRVRDEAHAVSAA
jgi:hypothetical protein